ncbi:MAG: isoprenylcysteine carboxylmethyltransferase family protein [Acidobacteriaceae bacterium]
MLAFYKWFFPAVWVVFLIYWQIAWQIAAGAKATTRLEPALSRVLRTLAFLVAIGLFFVPKMQAPWLFLRLLPNPLGCFWIGAAITVAGLLFAVWARILLGTNWSRSVTIKQDHELITAGPYSLIRHPIYTGILTGFLGSSIATGELRGLLAFILVFLALWYKLRLEESWMRSQFGDVYIDYSRHTSALVPWLL